VSYTCQKSWSKIAMLSTYCTDHICNRYTQDFTEKCLSSDLEVNILTVLNFCGFWKTELCRPYKYVSSFEGWLQSNWKAVPEYEYIFFARRFANVLNSVRTIPVTFRCHGNKGWALCVQSKSKIWKGIKWDIQGPFIDDTGQSSVNRCIVYFYETNINLRLLRVVPLLSLR